MGEQPELKPCPFCGKHGQAMGWAEWDFVRCSNLECEAQGPAVHLDTLGAIVGWNDCPVEDALRRQRDRLAEALQALVSEIQSGVVDEDDFRRAKALLAEVEAGDGQKVAEEADDEPRLSKKEYEARRVEQLAQSFTRFLKEQGGQKAAGLATEVRAGEEYNAS